MTNAVAPHPNAESLRAFGLGRLASKDSAAIEQHVEHCQACCDYLRSVADDSLVETLRTAELAAEAETVIFSGGASTEGVSAIPQLLKDHPRYHIKTRLGMGGMGVVFRAEHRLMQRDVALKVIHPRLVDRPEAVVRFRHEVQAAARINDEHVVRAYDAEQVDGIHFLVMEYVDGESVDRLLAREGRLPIARACSIARQTALGLQAAHAQGMAHRDIKPQNLMIDGSGRVKILDFGLSRFVLDQPADQSPRLTTGHVVLGTPDYMAPEQARESRTADIRSDIYSLGCTLYHMLAGRPPFPDGSVIEKLALHLSGRPRPLEELRPDVPNGLVTVIATMMARDPAARYQTPADVARALEPFTHPLPPPDRAVADLPTIAALHPHKPHHSKAKRTRTWLLLAVAVIAIAGVVIVAAPWRGPRTSAGIPLPPSPTHGSSLRARDDDFSETRLAKHWNILQPPSGQVAVENGSLVLIPDADRGWYNAGRGMFISQEVEGDFIATARLSVRGLRDPSGPPREPFNSAGLIARDPRSGPTDEMWIMISLGQQATFVGTKTEPTWQSQSRPEFQPTTATSGELRLARIGDRFSLLKRLDGEREWTLLQEHRFPQTPAVLQVGPAVNAYRASDIRAAFESVRFTVPTSASDLYRD